MQWSARRGLLPMHQETTETSIETVQLAETYTLS